MKIELNDDIAQRLNMSENELLEVLAVSLYKMAKINGVQGGKIIGKSEIEFHGLLGKYGQYVNYDVKDLLDDIDSLKDF